DLSGFAAAPYPALPDRIDISLLFLPPLSYPFYKCGVDIIYFFLNNQFLRFGERAGNRPQIGIFAGFNLIESNPKLVSKKIFHVRDDSEYTDGTGDSIRFGKY